MTDSKPFLNPQVPKRTEVMFVEEKICRNYAGNAFFCSTDTFSLWELTNGRGTFICLEVEGFVFCFFFHSCDVLDSILRVPICYF